MRQPRFVLFMCSAICLCLVSGLSAQDEEKKKKRGGNQMTKALLRPFAKAELTDEQETKIKDLLKANRESLMKLQKEANNILSDEQKQARRDAQKAAKEKGLKGKKATEFIMGEIKLDEETVAKMKETTQKLSEARLKFQKEVYSLLTDEQKSKIKNRRIAGKAGGKKKKGGGKKKDKKDDDG